MRLLGWMHNKLRHTSTPPFKDLTIGTYYSCLSATTSPDEKVHHSGPRFDSRYNKGGKNISEIEAKVLDANYEDETSTAMSELFHGFLAIGTLGSKPINSEPATPTFPLSFENSVDEKTEVTENELNLLNDELEKFLEAEAEEEGFNESLARSSYVSTITLSGMQMEGANTEDNGKTALFPLQEYLFNSLIELPETGVDGKKEKASLGEMFQRTKITEDICPEVEGNEKMHAKQAHKPAKHLIKKILRKLYASSTKSEHAASNNAASFFSTKKKFNKVLRMFHRKVHPENPKAEKEFIQSQDEEHIKFSPGLKSMEEMPCYKNTLNLSQYVLSGSDSSGNREHWIKTDADYLVLEL
ncbi:protein LAZY 1 [Mercurialis annua]|uniref:protein LAZY 1 n=1 Tax=Mercurialis annua TaxID=3986 RepID=UPI00215E4EA9|nr:protein LAZY 1 [Mercurialis annua]